MPEKISSKKIPDEKRPKLTLFNLNFKNAMGFLSPPIASLPVYLDKKLTSKLPPCLVSFQGRTSQMPEAQSSQDPEEEAA